MERQGEVELGRNQGGVGAVTDAEAISYVSSGTMETYTSSSVIRTGKAPKRPNEDAWA